MHDTRSPLESRNSGQSGAFLNRAARFALALTALSFIVLAVVAVRPAGDCAEYAIMSHGFVERGTPDIQRRDAVWLARRERRLHPYASELNRGLSRKREVTLGAHRNSAGRYYASHFWFYSLLAAPALFIIDRLNGPLLAALTLVNAIAASSAVLYAVRTFRSTWVALVVPLAFLLAGTTFYLSYPGPEVLTASAVFVGVLAARQGDVGLGFLAAGIAAAQNPSTAALFPFVLFEAWRRRRGSNASDEPAAPRAPLARTLELAVAGVLLALLPYLFYWREFGVPSLIAANAVDFRLIGREHLFSLFFDLNQGMVVGVPGLLVALLLALGLGWRRFGSGTPRLASTLALVLAMALPTLVNSNWNNDQVVFMRYAYWLAMPLLALLLELVVELPRRAAVLVLSVYGVLSLPVLALNGLRGRDSSYVEHGWLAQAVLKRAPSAYNPVAEIFIERTRGREEAVSPSEPVLWPRHAKPTKVLVHEAALGLPAIECVAGKRRVPTSTTVLASGWYYQDAPFTCEDAPAAASGP